MKMEGNKIHGLFLLYNGYLSPAINISGTFLRSIPEVMQEWAERGVLQILS